MHSLYRLNSLSGVLINQLFINILKVRILNPLPRTQPWLGLSKGQINQILRVIHDGMLELSEWSITICIPNLFYIEVYNMKVESKFSQPRQFHMREN